MSRTPPAFPGVGLPAHLREIEAVYVDESVRDAPMSRRVMEALSEVPVRTVTPGSGPLVHPGGGRALYLKEYKGAFLRNCPGTRRHHCCGYLIAHIGENCPFACSYCILQAYFQDRVIKVWANQEDLFTELEEAFHAQPHRRFRVGTGEFTDSLALEPVTRYSRDLIQRLQAVPNLRLELKSKLADLSWMEAVDDPRFLLPAWSLNAPDISRTEECGVSSLEERLRAARSCADQGFRVCLHFDPVIHFPGWERGYAQTVEMIFDHLKPEQIAYLSMGSFRHMPELTPVIRANWPNSTYIHGEFVRGRDNKMRLLRPLRVRQLRFLADRLKARGLDEALYLCMESSEVWRAVLGRTPRRTWAGWASTCWPGRSGIDPRLGRRPFYEYFCLTKVRL